MFAASSTQVSVTSSGAVPLSVSHASCTSSALPMALPRGRPMSVMRATVVRPTSSPSSTMHSASLMASSGVFMKAPLPHFTSSRILSAPAAIFLLMMLEAMSGMESTVAVTSRRA